MGEANTLLYKIKVQLKDIEPPIWRILRVPSRTRLSRLHRVLQIVMDWKGYHLYLFEIDGKRYGDQDVDWDFEVLDSRKLTLEKVYSGGRVSFLYEYDLGDSWRHEITLLGTVEGETGVKLACTAGSRACPPEDCGGTLGYFDLLIALSDHDHEDHDTLLEWVGGKFDPSAFDVADVDQSLKRLR